MMGMRGTRFGSWIGRVLVTLVVAMPLFATAEGAAAASPALGRAPLDLAALALQPDDLDARDYVEYGTSGGVVYDQEMAAYHVANLFGVDVEDVLAALVDDADVQGYFSQNVIATLDDGSGIATRGITTNLFEFANVEGVEQGYAFMREQTLGSDVDEIEVGRLGDGDSFGFTFEEPDPETGSPMTYVVAGFVVDRVYVEVMAWDVLLDGEDDELTDTDELAEISDIQAERIADGISQGATDDSLTWRVMRLSSRGLPVVTVIDRYLAIDGAPVQLYSEREADVDARGEAMAEDGQRGSYRMAQDIILGDSPSYEDPEVIIKVDSFEDDEAASNWMQVRLKELIDCDCLEEQLPASALPNLGDEILGGTITMDRGGKPAPGYVLLVRTGSYVSEVRYNSIAGTTIDQTAAITEMQIECAVTTCIDRIAIPADLT